ncbi:MAG: universal stress protein [Cyanobacteriota bacterium]|nr:universal stress protein [Cyanobacteriota bacterium]
MSWLRKNCVVVPIDFSSESFAALSPALEFVENASHIYVIHVLTRFPAAEPGIIWNPADDRTRKYHAEFALREQLDELEYGGIHIEVTIGDPSSEILDFAEAKAAGLIVISSRGQTGIQRFFLGSVVERVVRFSHCPVLVLR